MQALMSGPIGVIILFAFIIGAVVLGTKWKVNPGLLAFGLALVMGCGFGGMGAGDIANAFSGKFALVIIVCCGFFAYPAENGTMLLLAKKLIYTFRNQSWAMPWLMLIITWLITTMGADAYGGPILMSPFAFTVAMAMGFNPILATLAVWMGSAHGSCMPWAPSGVIMAGLYGTFIGEDLGMTTVLATQTLNAIAYVVIFAVIYFATKAYKCKVPPEFMEKPEAFSKEQKITLVMMFALIVLTILPNFLITILGTNPFLAAAARICDVRVLCGVGIIIASALKIADPVATFKRMPWGLLINLTGMMLLISVASQVGTIDYLVSFLTAEGLAPTMVVALIFLISAVIGAFTSALTTVVPLVSSMAPALSAALGLNPAWFCLVALIGSGVVSVNPYSTGGGLAITGCPEEIRDRVTKQQYLMMIPLFVLYAIIVFSPIGPAILEMFL